jgi:hypothetical protein
MQNLRYISGIVILGIKSQEKVTLLLRTFDLGRRNMLVFYNIYESIPLV